MRRTAEVQARLEEVAALKRLTPSYKQLEIETGINRNHLAKLIHDLVHRSNESYELRG